MSTKVPAYMMEDVYSKFQVEALIAAAIAEIDGGGTSGGIRVATLVIAASDSVNKLQSDVVCDGVADQVKINAAIAGYRGVPIKVLFRAGLYSLTDHILIDTSWITLEGELFGKWKHYAGSSGFNTFPRSVPGSVGNANGALFVQNTPGKGVFRVGITYFPGGETRHKDISFVRLAMWGPHGTGCAIQDLQAWTDVPRIEGCFFHGFQQAIDVAWDNGLVFDNNIQDTGGNQNGHAALRMRGYRGIVSRNTIYQVSGNGVWAGAEGLIVSDNIIGATQEHNILATSATIKINGNTLVYPGAIPGPGGNDKCNIVVANYIEGNLMSGLSADGCVINGNTIQRTHTEYSDYPFQGTGTGGGDGIRLGEGHDGGMDHDWVNHAVVTGNYISTGPATSGHAVNVDKGSAGCVVVGNSIRGPWASKVRTANAGSGGQYGLNA